MTGTKEDKSILLKHKLYKRWAYNRLIRRTFPPGEKLAYCKASKIANFQTEFDNTWRKHDKHIFFRNNLLFIPPFQNPPVGCYIARGINKPVKHFNRKTYSKVAAFSPFSLLSHALFSTNFKFYSRTWEIPGVSRHSVRWVILLVVLKLKIQDGFDYN